MSTPVIHLVVGPNGAGKTTLVTRVVQPVTRLPFVNADVIATDRWPRSPAEHAYDASRAAAQERVELMSRGRSFITETVFSHPSKLALVDEALGLGYLVHLHVILVPEALAVARVEHRARRGGHTVPEDKIRERFGRLWDLVAVAIERASTASLYDNTRAGTPFRVVARYENGRLVGKPAWPTWTPQVLVHRGRSGA